MALHTGIRQSRWICALQSEINTRSSQFNQKQVRIFSYRFNHEQRNGYKNDGSKINWNSLFKFGAAAGITTLALDYPLLQKKVLAQENGGQETTEQEIIDQEHRYVNCSFSCHSCILF